jgi:hypothetical protein
MSTANARAILDNVELPTARYRAIRTRYVGPTNTRGSRIIADAGDRASRVVVSYDPALNTDQNHAYAAVLVTRKMGWDDPQYFTPLVGGGYNAEYFWVFQNRPEPWIVCAACGHSGPHTSDSGCSLCDCTEKVPA